MKRTLLAGLIVLNAALLISLAVPPSDAQIGGARGGNYLMTSQKIKSERFKQPITIMDTQNGVMMTLMFDSSQKLRPFAARDIGQDFKAARGGG